MAKSSRVPPALGALPVVGELAKQAEEQARWIQDLLEQNTRLVAQLPATMKSFNDSLERFNQTVARLDRVVGQVEAAAGRLIGPLEQLSRRVDRLATVLGQLPGAALMRRLTGGEAAGPAPSTPPTPPPA